MSQITIGNKLILCFAALIVVVLSLGGSYVYSVQSLAGELRIVTDQTAKKLYLSAEMEAQLYRMRSCQRGVMLFSLEKLPEKALSNKQEFETRSAAMETLLGQLTHVAGLEGAQKNIAVFETVLPQFKGFFEQVAAAALAGDSKGALKIYTDNSSKSLDSLDAAVRDLVEIQKQGMQESSEKGVKASAKALWMAYILLAVGLGIGPIVLILVSKTTKQLRGVAASLAEGAKQITSASAQVASSSQVLAQGASEQAVSLEETSSSSGEITSMTRKNAEIQHDGRNVWK